MTFLSRCNGQRTLGELIAEVAEDGAVDFATAKASGLPLVYRLLRAGLLTVPPLRDAPPALGTALRDGGEAP